MINNFDKDDSERWDALPFYDKVHEVAEMMAKELEQRDTARTCEEFQGA